MTTVKAIQATNVLITLALNAIIAAQHATQVIAKAQEENRPISEAEWTMIVGLADAADLKLAAAIRDAS